MGVYLLAGREAETPALPPNEAAAASCAAAGRFEALVARNAPLDRVMDALREAEFHADSAAGGDNRWVGLQGGVKAVRVALDADDARAARIGIGVVRAACRQIT